ncbi:hypothetical protein PCE1_002838 [Barthelona sp. PCE]
MPRLRSIATKGDMVLEPLLNGKFYVLQQICDVNTFLVSYDPIPGTKYCEMISLKSSKCSTNTCYRNTRKGVQIWKYKDDSFFLYIEYERKYRLRTVFGDKFVLQSEGHNSFSIINMETEDIVCIIEGSPISQKYSNCTYYKLANDDYLCIYLNSYGELCEKIMEFPDYFIESHVTKNIVRVVNHPTHIEAIVYINQIQFISVDSDGSPYVEPEIFKIPALYRDLICMYHSNGNYYFFTGQQIFSIDLNNGSFHYDATLRPTGKIIAFSTDLLCVSERLGTTDVVSFHETRNTVFALSTRNVLLDKNNYSLPYLSALGCIICFSFWDNCVNLFSKKHTESNCEKKKLCCIHGNQYVQFRGTTIEVVDVGTCEVLHSYETNDPHLIHIDANEYGFVAENLEGLLCTQHGEYSNHVADVLLCGNIVMLHKMNSLTFLKIDDLTECELLDFDCVKFFSNQFNPTVVFAKYYDDEDELSACVLIWDVQSNTIKKIPFPMYIESGECMWIDSAHLTHCGKMYRVSDVIIDLEWEVPFLNIQNRWSENVYVVEMYDLCVVHAIMLDFKFEYDRFKLNVNDHTVVKTTVNVNMLDFLSSADFFIHNDLDML